jgi:hypothetical protein
MRTFFKTMFIVGLCGVGVVAAAHVVLGKSRTHDAARTLQRMAQTEIDQLIRRQHDLRNELAALRDEYPRQVAALRSQLSEIERREAEIAAEQRRAEEIVRLCEEDISYLEHQLDSVGAVYAGQRVIEHRGSRYTSAEAQILIGRIAETRGLYAGRDEDARLEQAALAVEREQLQFELSEVQAEQAEFEAEYRALIRELERLERNEELIRLRERKSSCAEIHGEAMRSLNGVKSALERARLEQEERMKAARLTRRSLDYEHRVKLLELQRSRELKQRTRSTIEALDTQTHPELDQESEEVEERPMRMIRR